MIAQIYKKAFDNTKNAIIISSPTEIIDINLAFMNLIKIRKKSELDKNQYIIDLIRNIIRVGEQKTYSSILDSQGNTIMLDISITLLNEEEQIYILGFKPIEDESLYKEISIVSTYNREIFNNSIDSIVILDNYSKILDVNNAFVETFGYTRYESIGKDIDDLIVNKDDREIARGLFQRVLNKEKVEIVTKRLTKTRKILDVKVIVYPALLNNGINENYVIYKDITKDREKDKLIHEKDEFLNQLFNRSLYPIAILDKKENVLDINLKFEELFGYSKEEALFKHINSLIVPIEYEKEAAKFVRLVLNKSTMSAKTKRINKNGELIDVEAVGSPVIIDSEVVGFFAMYRDIRVEEDALRNLNKSLNTDSLTGLFNREYIYNSIERKLEDEINSELTIIYLDLDLFKRVNDNLGHEVGDLLLAELSNRLKSEIDSNIEIARIGGDEFLAIINETNTEQIELFCNHLLKVIEKPFIINENEINISVSSGYARYPNDGITRDQLISRADSRMYEEKKKKRIIRNPIRVDTDISELGTNN